MQLLEVSAKEGYVWFRQGVWLFRKNPLAFLMLLFIYLIAAQLAIFVPLFGIIALLVFTRACRGRDDRLPRGHPEQARAAHHPAGGLPHQRQAGHPQPAGAGRHLRGAGVR
jgi:hypothetical protein